MLQRRGYLVLEVSVVCVCSFCSSAVRIEVKSGIWTYTLTMSAYTNAARTQLLDASNSKLHLNQKIWFEMKGEPLDESVVALVTHSCFATNDPSAESDLRYDLIING